jgi:hypothetical protein
MFKPWEWRYIEERVDGTKVICRQRTGKKWERWESTDEPEVVLKDYKPSEADPEDRSFVVRPDSREKWVSAFEYEYRWNPS